MSFSEWIELHRVQKPKLMSDVRNYMASRYDFSGKTIPRLLMSGGRKGIPAGPIAVIPKVSPSYESLS
jgi:hypothetical protein